MLKMQIKYGKSYNRIVKRIARLRTVALLSWVDISEAINAAYHAEDNDNVSARQCKLMFEGVVGSHQYHDHLPGKGGRWPMAWDTDAEIPFLMGDGTINNWTRVEIDEAA